MTERKFTPPTEFPAEYVDGKGNKVTILGRSHHEVYSLIGFKHDGGVDSWREDGMVIAVGVDPHLDLHDIPKRITTWHNVYGTYTHSSYVSRSLADQASIAKRLCVYRIERDEDGGNPEIFVEEV